MSIPRVTPSPKLEDLPAPPPGRSGWPWTEGTPAMEAPQAPPANPTRPRISVIVPSFNQGAYLEETIRSILLQNYPDVELLVADGGSTDSTSAVLNKYAPWISWQASEKDRGQSHAINKGFERAAGGLIAWQNSDDYYAPAAFHHAARAALAHPEDDVFYGDVDVVTAASQFDHHRPGAEFDLFAMFPWPVMHNQSFFFRRKILENGQRIDERWRHHMDQNFFWDLILAGVRFRYVREIKGCFRIHGEAKGARQFRIASQEMFILFERLLAEPSFPAALKDKIFTSLQGIVMDNYIKRELDLFRGACAGLWRLRGFAGLNLDLALKYALSFGGPGFLNWLNARRRRGSPAAVPGSTEHPPA